jgi:hypothetical protein
MEHSKKETGKLDLTEQTLSVLINNEKVKDPRKDADVFNGLNNLNKKHTLLKYIFAVKSIIYKFKTFTQNMIAS